MHVSHFDDAEASMTLDGSTNRAPAGRVPLPVADRSLAEATVPIGGATAWHHHVLSNDATVPTGA